MKRRTYYSKPRRKKKKRVFDANEYAIKKTVAQGMLDIALLASNASQLKYVLQFGPIHEFYTLLIALITISIILQVTVGLVVFTMNALRLCGHFFRWHRAAASTSNFVVLSVLLITLLNIFVSAFDSSLAAYLQI
ncbi:hypothetical protein O3G_MSEX008889 [Manduca sexta]|uniref:Ninjurin-1 n=1 Tax=Manduca sexta TaxID=7130 RepID=A0A922CPQ1_MANSE|nr:hypothetical protein O3G_MSEX008889 [Manduca sexta]KAG6454820.1 hypothetical protein O3G_MSEX008889 [Manduca sexta]